MFSKYYYSFVMFWLISVRAQFKYCNLKNGSSLLWKLQQSVFNIPVVEIVAKCIQVYQVEKKLERKDTG